MKYFLDSVRKEDIDKYANIITGVTSNPVLLKADKMTNYDFLNIMKNTNLIRFVQVTSLDTVKSIAKNYQNEIDYIIFKVTMHPQFYTFIKTIKNMGYKVAATTIYDIIQINQAIEMDLDYTMVYKAKNEYNELFNDAYKLKTLKNSNINLVGASFRNKHQIKEAILFGMDYATIPIYVFDTIFENAQLSKDIQQLYG